MAFRREEGLKDAADCFLIKSRARILNRDQDARLSVLFGLHTQDASVVRHRTHCVNRIGDEIEDHLLQLNPISQHLRQLARERSLDRYSITLSFTLGERQQLPNDRIYSKYGLFLVIFLEHRANTSDHTGSAVSLAD